MRLIFTLLVCFGAAQLQLSADFTCHYCEYNEIVLPGFQSPTCEKNPSDQEILDAKEPNRFYYCMTAIGSAGGKKIVMRTMTAYDTNVGTSWCVDDFFPIDQSLLPPGFGNTKTCYCNTEKCNNGPIEGSEGTTTTTTTTTTTAKTTTTSKKPGQTTTPRKSTTDGGATAMSLSLSVALFYVVMFTMFHR